jgi:hypothetical protein
LVEAPRIGAPNPAALEHQLLKLFTLTMATGKALAIGEISLDAR